MNISDEINKLSELRQRGHLSEEEYQVAKSNLLSGYQQTSNSLGARLSSFAADINMWCMMIHLSQFFGLIIPFFGLIVPILLWQLKKQEDERIDRHGRIVVNWILTEFVLAILFGLLSIVLIGYPFLIALLVVGVIFPVVGGIKASQGQVWSYPCSIKFF